MKILQWNLNGPLNNYPDLNILINEFSPDIIALQETHLPHNKTAFSPIKYNSYFHNLPQNSSCKQGIALFVKKSFAHKAIPISSNISALAVEIDIGFKLSIITCYIPPNQTFNSRELQNILILFPPPYIFLGDVNAWSPLWSSPLTNRRGEIIEDIVLSNNPIVLNDGSPTHFSTHGSFTHPDIILASASLGPKLSSRTLDELHNSDHFPLVTTLNLPIQYQVKLRAKFLTENADWPKFLSLLADTCSSKPSLHNINAEASST